MQFRGRVEASPRPGVPLAARPYSELIDEILPIWRGPRRRRAPAPEPAGGGQAADRPGQERSRAGRAAEHQRRSFRGQGDSRSPGRPGAGQRRPQGSRCHAPGSRADHCPLSRLRRQAVPGRHPAARTASSPTIEGARTSQVDIVFTRFVSTLVQRPRWSSCCDRAKSDTRGIPARSSSSNQRRNRAERLLPRYVGTRLYQTASRAPPASSPARWWP